MHVPDSPPPAFAGRIGCRNGVLVIDLNDDEAIEALYRSHLADELGSLCQAEEVLLKVRGQLRVRLHHSEQSALG